MFTPALRMRTAHTDVEFTADGRYRNSRGPSCTQDGQAVMVTKYITDQLNRDRTDVNSVAD